MKKILYCNALISVILILAFTGTSFAQDNATATGAASYLRLGSGARAIGMGKAYTSLANDASASFWNPAGLVGVEKFDFTITNRLFENADFGTEYFAASLAYKISEKYGSVGLSVFNYTVDEIFNFDENANYLGDFGLIERAVFLSYGYGNDIFSLGASLKYLTNEFDLGGSKAKSGYGFDVSFLYQVARGLKLGLILRDNVKVGDFDEMEGSVQAGTHYNVETEFFGFPQNNTLALDVEQLETRPMRLHFGFETELEYFSDMSLILRYGLSNFYLEGRQSKEDASIVRSNSMKNSFGLGIKLMRFIKGNIYFDYAAVIEAMDSTSFFTFRYDFN